MLHMYTRCVHCVYHTRSRYMNTLSWLSLELHTSIAPALPLGWAPTYRDQQITKTTKGDKHQLSYFEGLLFWELEPALLVLWNWLGSEWTQTKYEQINNLQQRKSTCTYMYQNECQLHEHVPAVFAVRCSLWAVDLEGSSWVDSELAPLRYTENPCSLLSSSRWWLSFCCSCFKCLKETRAQLRYYRILSTRHR